MASPSHVQAYTSPRYLAAATHQVHQSHFTAQQKCAPDLKFAPARALGSEKRKPIPRYRQVRPDLIGQRPKVDSAKCVNVGTVFHWTPSSRRMVYSRTVALQVLTGHTSTTAQTEAYNMKKAFSRCPTTRNHLLVSKSCSGTAHHVCTYNMV
jgi:hypothetical protein